MSVLLAGLMLLLATPQAAPAQATGSIAGLVQAADTQIPIPDARILITGPGVRDMTTADGSGRFTFTSLAPGVYRITIEKETFAYDVLGAPGVKIAAGVTANVTFNLQRAGIIVGEVRDDRGNPRSGIPVTAIRKIDGGTTTQPGTQRTTNDLGEFRLDGLLEGEYVVLASPPSGGVRTVALVPTYYPAATDRNAANTVIVKAGETIGAVFIAMASAPAFEITGTVVDEQGQPQPRVIVSFVFSAVQTAAPTQGTLQVRVAGVTTRADGTFRITGLRPGTYRLTPLREPTPPGIMNEIELASATVKGNASTVKVDLRDANVSGVTIVMHPPQ
jgi:carboxypeptidase family protein